MKYESHYESIQNCTPGGTELQQIINKCNSNFTVPLDMSASVAVAVADSISNNTNEIEVAVNGCANKKNITRKTCTCYSGLGIVSCLFHASGTDRSSINGSTNTAATTTTTRTATTTIRTAATTTRTATTNSCTHKKVDKMKTTSSKTNLKALKDEMAVNGKILHKTKQEQKFRNNQSSSRTFTIESSKCELNNNCDNSNPENMDELRLSLTSLISNGSTVVAEKPVSEYFQKWLDEKKRQERKIRQRESNLKQLLEQEKQRKIQMEQENFINWLHAKKQKEKLEKAEKKKALEEEQRRKNEKLKREEINKKQYQLWLKLKEEKDLVKKINGQKRRIEKEERERQRLEQNQCAFKEWLISAKDKPKPVPLNRGLESLRTSTSISFINPDPWVPNIEKPKATSK